MPGRQSFRCNMWEWIKPFWNDTRLSCQEDKGRELPLQGHLAWIRNFWWHEPVASLDVSIQAQVINLFRHLQKEHGFTFLFIAHDLAMVEYLCDRVGVMYHGKMVELGTTREVFSNPQHEYTKTLLSAIPIPDPVQERQRKVKIYVDTDSDAEEWKENSPGHFVLKRQEGGKKSAKE